eukprot:scaffold46926_cov14-Tisochrysis_lutea.AAC.1
MVWTAFIPGITITSGLHINVGWSYGAIGVSISSRTPPWLWVFLACMSHNNGHWTMGSPIWLESYWVENFLECLLYGPFVFKVAHLPEGLAQVGAVLIAHKGFRELGPQCACWDLYH